MRSQKFNFSKVIRKLQDLFDPSQINKLARECGFLQRFRKLDGAHFFMLCIGMKQGLTASLKQMCTVLKSLDIELSAESLHDRFNNSSVDFMKQMFIKCLRINIQSASYQFLSIFNGIYIQDGTAFQLPDRFSKIFKGYGGGASESAIKIDFTYDYQNSGWLDLKLCSGTDVDFKQLPQSYHPGSLTLRDLGYFKLRDFEQITKDKAFYLSRLKNKVTIYTPQDVPRQIDLLKISRRMKINQIISIPVLVGMQKMPARLVVQKIPKKVADEIRHKMRTDKVNKRKGLTKQRLDLCQVRAYITNIPAEIVTPQQIINLYHLRWQIELLFKAWKTQFKIHQVKEMKEQRFICLMLGNLIRILLNFKILSWAKATIQQNNSLEISEIKATQCIEIVANDWIQLFKKNTYYVLINFLKTIISNLKKFCIKQPKKGKLTPTNLCLT